MSLHAIAFGAHPDDVELTCGGTVAKLADRGYRVGVVALTAGELGTRGTPEIRKREFEEGARRLGASEARILGLPDGGLAANPEQRTAVIRLIREFRPNIVLAPYWEDRHPDHANGSRLVSEAAFLAGLSRLETGQPAHRPYRVLFYPSRFDFRPSFIVDVSRWHGRKLEAIRAHRSQFQLDGEEGGGDNGGPETNVSHRGFLEAVVARDRFYGSCIGVEYGEAFLVREPPALDDPVEFFGPQYLKAFV